jgi:hypothetical protein
MTIGTVRSRLRRAGEALRLLMGIDEEGQERCPGSTAWSGSLWWHCSLSRGGCSNHPDGTRRRATWTQVGLEVRDGVSE